MRDSISSPVLHNPRFDEKARAAMVSVPVRAGESWSGLGNLATQVQPVGWWPELLSGQKKAVRRQLMFGLSTGPIPKQLTLTEKAECPTGYAGPEISCSIVSKKNVGIVLSEVNEAVISMAQQRFCLRLGLVHKGEIHWWQWVRLEQLWGGPLCQAWRLGGFIEVERFDDEFMVGKNEEQAAQSKAIHYHNWLRGDVYVLLFANGVVQLTCRHINNHMFDHGRDLEDALPIMGFRTHDTADINENLDGSRTRFDLGGVQLNLDQAARFFGPAHPGRLATQDGIIVYQPYEGIEILGDLPHRRARTDGFIVKAEDKVFSKGVARSVTFTVSLSAAAPVISRLTVPDWHYAVCRDMWGDEVLPVYDDWDAVTDYCQQGALKAAGEAERCFDTAILTSMVWEGEIPFSQMLHFYRTGNLDFFEIALNDSYHNADIGFDHATETMRMHNYPFGAIALPLFRTVAMTYAHLETGDPYLLECAESAAVRYYWLDKHNWPRRCYGRDAASIRSLIFLWDYTGEDHYLRMAREALGRALQCQRPDGSTGDQGGAVGPCGGSASEITKVWMAMMASDPVIDYLQRQPDDAELWQSLKKTGEFVLRSQLQKNNSYYWAYEYGYGDNPGNPLNMQVDPEHYERHPRRVMVNGYKARFLSFLSVSTGDGRFLEAWQKFHDTNWAITEEEKRGADGTVIKPNVPRPDRPAYASNKLVQNIPYAQAHKWNARISGKGIRIRPILTDWSSRLEGDISTPWGRLHIQCWRSEGQIALQTRCDVTFPIEMEAAHGGLLATLTSNDSQVVSIKPD